MNFHQKKIRQEQKKVTKVLIFRRTKKDCQTLIITFVSFATWKKIFNNLNKSNFDEVEKLNIYGKQ